MKRLASVLAVAALLGVGGCTAGAEAPPAGEAAAPSGPRCIEAPSAAGGASGGTESGPALPAMALQCFSGGRWTSVADLAGVPTIVNLWASWCTPCRAELPVLQQAATAGAGRVRVVGIVTKDRHDQAQSVIEDAKLTFPMLEDQGQQFATVAGSLVSKALVALPATLFVTADGHIAYAYQGEALTAAHLRALTAQYLGVGIPE